MRWPCPKTGGPCTSPAQTPARRRGWGCPAATYCGGWRARPAHRPGAVRPDGRRLIVTCAAPRSTVVVLDAASGRTLAAIPAGHTAMGPALSPDGRQLYVCNRFDGDVSVIDMAALKEKSRIAAGREPVAAAVTPDGRGLLVARTCPTRGATGPSRATWRPQRAVIDTRTREATEIGLPHGSSGVRGLCIARRPAGPRHPPAGQLRDGSFSRRRGLDRGQRGERHRPRAAEAAADGRPGRERAGAGNPWDVVCTADGKWVGVSLAGTHEVAIIERSTLTGPDAASMSPMMGVWPIYTSMGDSLWRRVKLPGKGPRGLAAAGSKIYAAQYFSDTVAVVDLAAKNDAPVAAIALGPPPRLTPQRRGQLLFHDATICYQQWLSCASCHPDGRADGLNWDLLNDGEGNPRTPRACCGPHRTPPAMWEGVRSDAEEAVRSGIRHILFADRPEGEAAAIDAYLESRGRSPARTLSRAVSARRPNGGGRCSTTTRSAAAVAIGRRCTATGGRTTSAREVPTSRPTASTLRRWSKSGERPLPARRPLPHALATCSSRASMGFVAAIAAS